MARIGSPPNSVGAASGWIEGALTGTVATTAAVIAVAWIGFLMLSGRVEIRRAAHVVLGCFIIFGAATIAAGVQSAVFGADAVPAEQLDSALPPPPAYPAATPQDAQSIYDPYAGAGLPPSR